MKYLNLGHKRSIKFKMVTWLIIVNVIVSTVGIILFNVSHKFLDYFALKPNNILNGQYLWTLVTHIFFHGGFLHSLVNMVALFSLGRLCEMIIGKKRFFWFYLIAGVFAGLVSVLFSGFLGMGVFEKVFGGADLYMVGASGAIFGVAGLFVILLPRLKFTIIFLPFFSLPAYIMVPLVLVLTWVVTLTQGLNIGNVAHLGGFIAGIGYGYYLKLKYRQKVKMIQRYFR